MYSSFAAFFNRIQKKKPFNYNRVNENILIGRSPISFATVDALATVTIILCP
jgi:hypothetical protein